jgi:outer membrane protein assembly factor BamD (BamD/ComL family)
MAAFLILYFSATGVIITDNVWFYGNHQMAVLNTGDLVEIVSGENNMVKVKYTNGVGEIHKGVLIDLTEEIAEDELFVFCRGYFDEEEYKKSIRLSKIFIKFLNNSEYLAEVLYYLGRAYEQVAKIYKESDSIKCIVLNKKTNRWYYTGDEYRKILERFPNCIYASGAAYHLIKLFRQRSYPWNDSLQPIQEELNRWQRFIKRYKNSQEYVLALSEIGYLERVLYEITEDPNYREDAIKNFRRIIKRYPNSVYSAQSIVNLKELETGKKIYRY